MSFQGKTLFRSRRNRIFTGVCGGVAEYFNIDANLVRIIWLVCMFAVAPLIAYIAASFLLPEN